MLIKKSSLISRKDHQKVVEAEKILANCIYRHPSSGETIDGINYVHCLAMETKEDVEAALKCIAEVYGINLHE